MFNYEHPTIVVEFPAPGHYSIRGLPQQSVFVEGEGHIVAPDICYISPAVPDDVLEAILRDRADRRERNTEAPGEIQAEEQVAAVKRGRGRPRKVNPFAEPGEPPYTTSTSPIDPETGAHEIK